MFDKEKYRERRNKGLQGVEDLRSKPRVALFTKEDYKKGLCGKEQIGKERTSGVTMMMTKKGLVANPRRAKRQKVVDRHTTKKTFVYGTKIGSKAHGLLEYAKRKFAKEHKGERIPSEEQRIHLENHPLQRDPKVSNHARALANRKARDAARSSKAA